MDYNNDATTLKVTGSAPKGPKSSKKGSSSSSWAYHFKCNNCELKINARFLLKIDSIYEGASKCPFCKSSDLVEVGN